MPRRARKRHRRYTEAQKRRILEAAKREQLTGDQVAKRFGVSALTFYRWRGPVRRRRSGARIAGRSVPRVGDSLAIRDQVRAGLRRVLPQLIKREVAAVLDDLLGGKRG